MKGSDTAWNRNGKAEPAHQREEERIDHVKPLKKRSRPYSRCRHQPVHGPDECGIGEEEPFPLHVQAA